MKKYFKFLFSLFLITLLCSCTKIEVKKELDFEINSELKMKDLVIENEKITLLEEDEIIDTSMLGKKKVIIKYLDSRDHDKYKTVFVNIVDTTKPEIAASNISVTKGTKINFESYVKVSDNSKEELKPVITGDYDLNKVGNYTLTASASDSSGNTQTQEFTLTIKNYTVKASGYYVYKAKTYWTAITFRNNNKSQILYNTCPGSACGGISQSGTYKLSDNKVSIHSTSMMDESGSTKMNSTMTCVIVSDTKINCSNYIYTWNKTFN